jgi:hypothetical protein
LIFGLPLTPSGMVKEQVRVTVSPAIIFEEGEDFRNRVTVYHVVHKTSR